jgi:putative ABC transport system ATP-binding protein
MGPSGCGKSTLLHVLGGIEPLTTGRVLLEGADLVAMTDDQRTLLRRRRLGFVFQSFNLLPRLTAVENVALPLLLDRVPRAEAGQRAESALERVGLAHRRGHVPGGMSGGEQQRVAVARTLAIEPAVILADEPTGNLDSASGEQIVRLLRSVVDDLGHSVVLVTHDPRVAEWRDRLIRMQDGQVVGTEGPGRSSEGGA